MLAVRDMWQPAGHGLPWSRFGSKAGIACGQAEFFPSLTVQEALVRLRVGAEADLGTRGSALGMETPGAPHEVLWAWGRVGI